uniref:RING-type domain-containing protein n=1 Tax=Phytophthora ramorum TaxID=164328 RepID=H3HCK1_PHYRM
MSLTEQIARLTRKSTVLDPKNALLIMAIPDYDDYKIMQPYSCRSLSNKSKFVGGRDFITRHNPQEVNDFKKQYSRDVGNLNRHRSILAPPPSNLSAIGLFSSSSGSANNTDPCAPGTTISKTSEATYTSVIMPLTSFLDEARDTIVTFGILCSRQKKAIGFSFASTAASSEERLPVVASVTQHFAMEVSPPSLALGTLQTGQVYLFPIVQGRSKKQSYALYCGQGRVIHAWTPSRQSYRVRVDSLHSIQRAKTVLHAVATSRASNLSFILFARFGDRIFALLRSLKEAYGVALGDWTFGALTSAETGNDNEAASATLTEPAITVFFGTNAELLMSEWLGRSLVAFVGDPDTKNQWYAIPMPAGTNYLTPLCLMYDKQHGIFRLRCNIAHGLPERMAADRMECGVCWMDFATLRVMVMKCNHYICDPCLRLLLRRECPYCRAPIRFAHEISDLVKRKALQIMMDGLALEEKTAGVPLTVGDTNQETLNNNDEPEHDN